MPFAHNHILLRFSGHFGTSSSAYDHWSTGLRVGKPTGDMLYDESKMLTFVTAALTAAKTFHAAAAGLVGGSCFLDQASGALVGLDGKYDPTTQNTVTVPTTPTAGGSITGMPFNTALVISLRTARPRGYASNGRCYWPATAAFPDQVTGRMTSATVTGRINLFKTFVNAVNTAANSYEAGAQLVVASSTGGITAAVTAIRSDDRLDSIERRENEQLSTWTQVSIP